jgi:hypothetical protein
MNANGFISQLFLPYSLHYHHFNTLLSFLFEQIKYMSQTYQSKIFKPSSITHSSARHIAAPTQPAPLDYVNLPPLVSTVKFSYDNPVSASHKSERPLSCSAGKTNASPPTKNTAFSPSVSPSSSSSTHISHVTTIQCYV